MATNGFALRRLRQYLADDRFGNDARLPAERDLARELKVSRTTLRKALAVLEAEGTIRRHVGQGTFIGSRAAGMSAENLSLSFRPSSPAEIFEARLMVEPQIAATAALQANAADIEHLRYFMEKSERAPNFEAYELWDTSLHRAIAEASHNSIFVIFMEIIRELRRYAEWGEASRAALTIDNQRNYSTHHRAVVAAIAGRNPRQADRTMRDHLGTVKRDMLTWPP